MAKPLQTLRVALLLTLLATVAGCAEKPKEKPPLTPAQVRGERLYQTSCAVCHRADSETPLNGPGLKGMFEKKFLTSGLPANDERVREIILRGRRTMPGYAGMYSDQQMDDLMAYLHSL